MTTNATNVGYRGLIDIYNTPSELDPADPTAQIALVMNPLTLYVRDSAGTYQVLSTGSAPPAPSPASEAALGSVELATEPEVQAGTAGILVATAARLKAELDRRATPAASETVAGKVELATAAETSTGTDNTRAVHPAGFKSAITPEAWIAPTLLNSWVNYGLGHADTAYYKFLGRVYLKGLVKNGTVSTTSTGSIFVLPSEYRPAEKELFGVNANGVIGNIAVDTDGSVRMEAGSNAYVALNGISFRAA